MWRQRLIADPGHSGGRVRALAPRDIILDGDQEAPVARVPTHDIASAADGSTEPLARQSGRVGKTLNIFGAMAHSPSLAAATKAGFCEDETIGSRRGHVPDDDQLNALLAVERAIAADNGYVDDRVWQAPLDAGWSEVALLDAYARAWSTGGCCW